MDARPRATRFKPYRPATSCSESTTATFPKIRISYKSQFCQIFLDNGYHRQTPVLPSTQILPLVWFPLIVELVLILIFSVALLTKSKEAVFCIV